MNEFYLYMQAYPVGTTVYLTCDDPDDEPHEIAGYKSMDGSTYLIFTDESVAHVGQVAQIVCKAYGLSQTKYSRLLIGSSIFLMLAALALMKTEGSVMTSLIFGGLSVLSATMTYRME